MNLKNTLRLPIALAVTMLAVSPAWSAGRIVNLKAVEDDAPYNGFIVRYKSSTTERRDLTAMKAAVRGVTNKLLQSKAVDPSFRANARRAFAIDHIRMLGNQAHLFKPSRKLARAEALATLRELANNPNVEFVEPNLIFQHQMVPDDPLYSEQWGYSSLGIRAEQAWDLSTGAGVTVAVLDTGITSHPDLDANVVPGYDFVSDLVRANDGDGRDADSSDPGDLCPSGRRPTASWHGTHVAGTIAALTNNGLGVAGVAFGAKIMPVRVLGVCGGELADIADAIRWASGGSVPNVNSLAPESVAKVINMSLGGAHECGQSYMDAILEANSRGTTVVVAAGNSNRDAMLHSPASCPGVVTVAAIDQDSNRASFSNYGPRVDLAAPGVEVLSTMNSGASSPEEPSYTSYSGTSMATPHVAGVAALVQSRRLTAGMSLLDPALVRNVLKVTSRTLPGVCPGGCGSGIVDAPAALSLAVSTSLPIQMQTDASGKVSVVVFERKATAAAGRFTNFSVEVPENYVVIGGGVQGAGAPDGHLITASYPNSSRSAWLVSTKEHLQSSPTAITAWAIGLKISGLTRAQLLSYMTYRTSSSAYSENPTTISALPAGYIQLGGGFQVTTNGAGNLAWASYPTTTANGTAAWAASAKDHGAVSNASIRSYSIGLRSNLPNVGVVSALTVTSDASDYLAQPAAFATLNSGYALTGCGGNVNSAGGYGSLLWKIEPVMNDTASGCTAQSTEHLYASPASINAVAVGIRVD